MEQIKYGVWHNYDVWGNENDGFEVNDSFERGEIVIQHDATDADILSAVNELLGADFTGGLFVCDFGGSVDLCRSSGHPVFTLLAIDI